MVMPTKDIALIANHPLVLRTTEEQQTYAIRLPDGEMVEWTAQELAHYDGDWHVNLTIEQSEKLYHAIMEGEA